MIFDLSGSRADSLSQTLQKFETDLRESCRLPDSCLVQDAISRSEVRVVEDKRLMEIKCSGHTKISWLLSAVTD